MKENLPILLAEKRKERQVIWYNAGLDKDSNYQYSSLLCVSLSAHNLLNVFVQLFSLERAQYTLEGNWMMVMSQVGVSIETICRNH